MELEKLKYIVGEILGLPPEDIPEKADFTEDLGADSMELFRIVTAIEEAFETEIPLDTAYGIRSLKAAAEALASL